ncbi:SDR family oxidoreductase [Nocardiopsis sp. HNM0947]|uniref:SDR family oxidoreductase n=1 Tax=Nocardiopsis coralli TaxID=2772213 RepID=A0ABR9PEW8_9ACTN|nr:SDR family NAD(P)-dependent oxidoreductase [Nocardiopsis coralli]MBE3002376.1 SDR family oxidoreductase [Nocardiopsis coralli]
MRRFDGKRALVTGAASGIGRATVVRLVSEGAAVLAVDRDTEGLHKTMAAAEGLAGHAVPHTADVTDEVSVEGAVGAAVSTFGGLDVLVNVAGIHRATPIEDLTVDDLHALFSVNLVGTALFCRAAVPHLGEGGAVVNVASAAAIQGNPYMSAYSASKGAVLSFSRSLAAELVGRGIRVVPVCPGEVATPLTAGGAVPEHVDRSYFGRIRSLLGAATPEQIAGVLAFAASEDGGYVTGTELTVDGGSRT